MKSILIFKVVTICFLLLFTIFSYIAFLPLMSASYRKTENALPIATLERFSAFGSCFSLFLVFASIFLIMAFQILFFKSLYYIETHEMGQIIQNAS